MVVVVDLNNALTEISEHIDSRLSQPDLSDARFELVLVQEVIADIRERK